MNKKQILQKVMNDKKASKLRAEVLAEAHFLHACKNPAFLALEKEKRGLELKQINAGREEAKKLQEEVKKVIDKQAKVLSTAGINQNEFSPQYSCKKCNDLGFASNKKCACVEKTVNSELLKQSGINARELKSFKLADDKIIKSNKVLSRLYEIAKDFCNKFPNTSKTNLVLVGDVGVGKTYLLECIANELLTKQNFVIFTTAHEFSTALQKAYVSSDIAEKMDIMETFTECDLLIIDDLGSEAFTRNLTVPMLLSVLNERLHKGRHTLMSTNLNLEQLEDMYGNRIFSRLIDTRTALLINVTGQDLRIKR